MALLGCSNDVAAYNATAFANRAGELIAKAVAHSDQTQIRLPQAKRGRDSGSKDTKSESES